MVVVNVTGKFNLISIGLAAGSQTIIFNLGHCGFAWTRGTLYYCNIQIHYVVLESSCAKINSHFVIIFIIAYVQNAITFFICSEHNQLLI
jgi:hypothetical protein